jgi:hypothetical protein
MAAPSTSRCTPTAATAILAPLVILAGGATASSPDYVAARDECKRETMQRVAAYEPLLVKGTYIERRMADRG